MKRNITKSKLGKAFLVTTASVLVVVTVGDGILRHIKPITVMAKESFAGIGKIVEEHDEDNPYMILDIVPSVAYYDVQMIDDNNNSTGTKRYSFSTGTMGYLTNGQSTLTQDLKTVFDENPEYLYYASRLDLYTGVVSQYAIDSFPGIQYEEAYGGVHNNFSAADGWTLLFENQEIDFSALADVNNIDRSNMSEGVFEGTYQKIQSGEDSKGYDFISLNGAATGTGLFHTGMYQPDTDGDWHVIFSEVDDSSDLADLYVVDSAEEYNVGSYSRATGLYLLDENGRYCYVGTVDQIVYGRNDSSSDGKNDDESGDAGTGSESSDLKKEEDGDGSNGSEDGESNNDDSNLETGEGNDDDSNLETGEGNDDDSNLETEEGDDDDSGSETRSEVSKDETEIGKSGNNSSNTADDNEKSNKVNFEQWHKLVENDVQSNGNPISNDSINNNSNAGSDNGRSENSNDKDNDEDVILKSDVQYYVVLFKPAEDISGIEEIFYAPDQEEEIYDEDGAPRPFDAYEWLSAETEEDADGISTFDFSDTGKTDAGFLYVGSGNGDYKLTASEGDTAKMLEVYNAPVYFRCHTDNNWLEKYVFSSLEDGDNEDSSFEIQVKTVRADEVTADMIREADLLYLESGYSSFLNPTLYTEFIQVSDSDWTDMGDGIAGEIIRRVSDDLMPIIVDYDIVEDEDNYADTNYQYLAKALLKQDLSTFYAEMNIKGNLMDNLRMNVDKTEDFPNKKDNDYNYVNKNVYIVNDEMPLVSEDFHDAFDQEKTSRGFADVLAAIKAENTTLAEEDQISLSVSKARAIQYIINYSVGIIGEYDDLSILELQPTANAISDLHIVVDDKDNTKLCWQTDSMTSAKQILFSKNEFDINTSVKSVAQFNGEWEDINSEYDLVFIGLDGQKLNLGNDRYRSPVYNKESLEGKVYHTGDESGVGAYDGNDITAQKMTDLLEYMEAGYPVLVEDKCFIGGSAQKADEDQINTKYIDGDSVMYHFLKSAITDERYRERIFTVSDTMSSAMFMMQLKISKPRVELQKENDMEPPKVQQLTLDENGEYHGKIAYEIKDNRGGEYFGETEVHLYADLNYDGIFQAEEELSEYINEANVIDVTISGMGPGILPWKLEITDTGNPYRRDSVRGYFELNSSYPEEIHVLQIVEKTDNVWMNLQEMYMETENSVLSYYLHGAESIANISMQFETITAGELGSRVASNDEYLNQWDVVILVLDDGAAVENVADAVTRYVNDGRSLLVCSQNADSNRMGLDAELLGQMQENRTYVCLGANGASGYYRYAGLKREMFEPQTNLRSEQVNEGSIAYYPYQLESSTFTCGANTALRASEYLLDFENNLKSESNAAYVTAWYTLGGSSLSSAYGISPKDARNNYYCYSKGNVVYLGQSEYPYSYDAEAGEKPDGKNGDEECKFFVNALMAAYSAGVHRADIKIVSGFAADSAQIYSISVPFDQEWRDAADATAGVLDNTVDVYFRFADSNIAANKDIQISFYYENPQGDVLLDGMDEPAQATRFSSEIWTVTDNKLILADADDLLAGKVYRIQAPVVALKTNDTMNNANIYIVLQSSFKKGNRTYEVISGDSVSLNRAQLFLLE